MTEDTRNGGEPPGDSDIFLDLLFLAGGILIGANIMAENGSDGWPTVWVCVGAVALTMALLWLARVWRRIRRR